MPRQQLNDLSLEIPAGWQDQTISVFKAVPAADEKFTPNFVLTREMTEGDESIRAYADQQLVILAKRLEALKLIGRRELTLGGRQASEVCFSWKSAQGPLQQLVVFVRGKGATMLTFTATAPLDKFAVQEAAFRAMVSSVQFPDESARRY